MHGADALAAARCAWGAEGSFGATPQCAWSGGAIKKECMGYGLSLYFSLWQKRCQQAKE